MHSLIRFFLYISLISATLPAGGDVEISDIQLADAYNSNGQTLTLNGAGIRSKFFVKVYIGALYLDKPASDAHRILQSGGPKSMQMIMLYKEIEAEKITKGWRDGFKANLTADQYKLLEQRLAQFNALFPSLKKGDHVTMDFIPGQGTTVNINGKTRGNIKGADFFSALLHVWIGNHPADKTLKRGLLGE